MRKISARIWRSTASADRKINFGEEESDQRRYRYRYRYRIRIRKEHLDFGTEKLDYNPTVIEYFGRALRFCEEM